MNVFIFCFGTHKSTSESVHHDKVNIMYLLLFNCSSKNKIKISFYVNFTNIYIWKNVHYLRNHYIHIVLSSLQKSLCHAIIESKATIINSFQFYSTSHLVVYLTSDALYRPFHIYMDWPLYWPLINQRPPIMNKLSSL